VVRIWRVARGGWGGETGVVEGTQTASGPLTGSETPESRDRASLVLRLCSGSRDNGMISSDTCRLI